MSKYPLSVQDSIPDGKVSEAFHQLLQLHVPEGAKILDPTAGSRLLWKNILFEDELNLGLGAPYDITFSDIKEGDGNLQQNLARARMDRPEWFDAFDCCVYDPPYLIGENETSDPREGEYGTYAYSLADLEMYMGLVHTVIPSFLKPGGKLILKCSDQFVVPERKFYLHHYDWLTYMMRAFDIIDLMIYRHHRMSPTAFQVKQRPCSVIMHTYYLVGQMND